MDLKISWTEIKLCTKSNKMNKICKLSIINNTRIPNKFHLQVKNIKQSLTWRTGSEEIDKKI